MLHEAVLLQCMGTAVV